MTGPLLTGFLVKTISDAIRDADFPLADTAILLLNDEDPAAGRAVTDAIRAGLAARESRSSGTGFCADCLSTGVLCPDHLDAAATSTANRGNPA